MSLGRLSARSGTAALIALAATAVTASVAFGADAPVKRDETPLPKQLTGTSTAHAAHTASTGGAIARTIAGLAIVLAVVFAIYWLLRAYARAKKGRGDGKIEVIATTPLAPNRSVHLLRVGDGLILVGSAEGSVTQLRCYSPEESDLIQAQLDGDADPLWQLNRGGNGQRAPRSFMDELRRRTAR